MSHVSWHSPRLVGSILLLALLPVSAQAQDYAAKGFQMAVPTPRETTAENLAAGKALYGEYCSQCHGDEGDGQGVAAERLVPRPRDFRRGIYKIRSTIQGELPVDGDLFRIIQVGMPGTSMPTWEGLLSDEEIWQLVDYLKGFSPDFADYPAEQEFVFEGEFELTPESVALGAEIYVKAECAKCHGERGRGNGPSAAELEDEWANRIFPADLTQPWTFRGGGSVKDLYRTLTTGLNGTPMPSFSDAWDAPDLLHLANYVRSIGREPSWGEIVRGTKTDAVPEDPDAPEWDAVPVLDVRLAGQIIQKPRLFNPSVQSLRVRALFDDDEVALLVTWNDRFENRSDGEKPSDQVAVLFPAEQFEEGKKPYFLMGDRRRAVDAWQWSDTGIETFLGRGTDAVAPRTSNVIGRSSYRDGQYRVLLRRSLTTNADDEVAFTPGLMIPIAWNVWDGENGEEGKRRAISRWYYLLLEPATPWTTWLWPIFVVSLTAGGEVFGMRRLRRGSARQEAGT